MSAPSRSVDVSDYVKVDFSGYNNEGIATMSINDDEVNDLLASLKEEYEEELFHPVIINDDDYIKFRQGLSFSASQETGLTNGDRIKITVDYDKQLAKRFRLDVTGNTCECVVYGLENVERLTLDDVFADLDVGFSGISPGITVELRNTSIHPFIKDMTFEVIDPKETYSDGDIVRVRADYTEEMCEETGYIVEKPADECIREYVASSDQKYITDASALPSSLVNEAIEVGKMAFKDANEYGVRVFCEGGLVPVYINKKATFVYGTPRYVSAYFKTVFPEKAGKIGLSYNDLDIIYSVEISQADGKGCTATAAVRFSDIIQNSDGTISCDFSNPSVLTESFYSSRVKSNVVDSYYSSYEVTKVGP